MLSPFWSVWFPHFAWKYATLSPLNQPVYYVIYYTSIRRSGSAFTGIIGGLSSTRHSALYFPDFAEGRKIDGRSSRRPGIVTFQIFLGGKTEGKVGRVFAAHRLRYSVILCSAGASWKKYHRTLFRCHRFPWKSARLEMKFENVIVSWIVFEAWFDVSGKKIASENEKSLISVEYQCNVIICDINFKRKI